MTAPLTDEWIREQLALCAEATPGPWIAQWHAWDGASGLHDQYRPLEQWEGLEKGWGMQVSGIGIDTTHSFRTMRREDLLLVVAARQGYALVLQALLDCREIARIGLNVKKETDASTE